MVFFMIPIEYSFLRYGQPQYIARPNTDSTSCIGNFTSLLYPGLGTTEYTTKNFGLMDLSDDSISEGGKDRLVAVLKSK